MAQQPPKKPPRDPNSIGSMIGTIAIAVGAGVIGYYILDGHSHTCEACGHKWRHLGVFNLGDPNAHACEQCGTVQWYKDGIAHVYRTALRVPPTHLLPGSVRDPSAHAHALAGTPFARLLGKPSAPAPLSLVPSVRGVTR